MDGGKQAACSTEQRAGLGGDGARRDGVALVLRVRWESPWAPTRTYCECFRPGVFEPGEHFLVSRCGSMLRASNSVTGQSLKAVPPAAMCSRGVWACPWARWPLDGNVGPHGPTEPGTEHRVREKRCKDGTLQDGGVLGESAALRGPCSSNHHTGRAGDSQGQGARDQRHTALTFTYMCPHLA